MAWFGTFAARWFGRWFGAGGVAIVRLSRSATVRQASLRVGRVHQADYRRRYRRAP